MTVARSRGFPEPASIDRPRWRRPRGHAHRATRWARGQHQPGRRGLSAHPPVVDPGKTRASLQPSQIDAPGEPAPVNSELGPLLARVLDRERRSGANPRRLEPGQGSALGGQREDPVDIYRESRRAVGRHGVPADSDRLEPRRDGVKEVDRPRFASRRINARRAGLRPHRGLDAHRSSPKCPDD